MLNSTKNNKNIIGFFVFQLIWWGLFYLNECGSAEGFYFSSYDSENLTYFVSPLSTIIGFVLTTCYKFTNYNKKLVPKKYSENLVCIAVLALSYTLIFSILGSILYLLQFVKLDYAKHTFYAFRTVNLFGLFIMFFTWFLIDVLVKNYKNKIISTNMNNQSIVNKYFADEYYILFVLIFWISYGFIGYYLVRHDWFTGIETSDTKIGMLIPVRVFFGIPMMIAFKFLVIRLLNIHKSLPLIVISAVCFGVFFSNTTGWFFVFFEQLFDFQDSTWVYLLELGISFSASLYDIFLFLSLASILFLQTCQIKYYEDLAE